MTDIHAHFILVLHGSEVAQVIRPTEQFYKAPLVLCDRMLADTWDLEIQKTNWNISISIFFDFLWFYIGLILITIFTMVYLFVQAGLSSNLSERVTESQMKIVPLGYAPTLNWTLLKAVVRFMCLSCDRYFPIDSFPMSLWSF